MIGVKYKPMINGEEVFREVDKGTYQVFTNKDTTTTFLVKDNIVCYTIKIENGKIEIYD